MASSAILLISFLLLCSAGELFLAVQAGPETGLKLIHETCSDTDDPELCVSSFMTDPQSTKVYYKDLGGIISRMVVANATDTRHYIKVLLKETEDSRMEICLKSCEKNYKDMIDGLKSASHSLDEFEFEPLEDALRVAKIKAEACEEAFKKPGGLKSPLTQRNEIIGKLADNGFVIVGDMMV